MLACKAAVLMLRISFLMPGGQSYPAKAKKDLVGMVKGGVYHPQRMSHRSTGARQQPRRPSGGPGLRAGLRLLSYTHPLAGAGILRRRRNRLRPRGRK